MALELFGTKSCQYTTELREDLEWRGLEFSEYDVEADPEALRRMLEHSNGQRTVPILLEDGKLKQIGWQGRSCVVESKLLMSES